MLLKFPAYFRLNFSINIIVQYAQKLLALHSSDLLKLWG